MDKSEHSSRRNQNPKKNLPLALIIGIGGVTVIYTLFNFAIMKVLPHDEIVT